MYSIGFNHEAQMKTKNDMRGITRLTRIAPVLFLVLVLFACPGGNTVNKKKEAQKYIKELDHQDSSVQIRAAIELGKLKHKGSKNTS